MITRETRLYLMEAVNRLGTISRAIDNRLSYASLSPTALRDVYEYVLKMRAAVDEAELAVQFALQSAEVVKTNQMIAPTSTV